MVHDPRHKAGAVKGGGGRAAAPDIGIAQVLLRLLYHGGELFILQRIRGYLIPLIICAIEIHIVRSGEQVGPVAQRGHIHGVHGELVLRHGVDRHMGEVEVFQRDGADVVGVFLCFIFTVRICDCSRAGLGGDGLRQDSW